MTVPKNISNYAGEHSSPLRVGNNLCVAPQNYIKIYGRAWKPAPKTGRRVVAPYPLPLRGSTPSQCEGDVAKRQGDRRRQRVAFAAGKRRRERNGKISPPVKCCAFDSLALSRYPILFTAWSAEQNRPLRPQMFPFSATGGGHICCPSEGA